MVETAFENIEPIIERLMREAKVPGLALGVVKDGKPFYSKGWGKRNVEKNLSFTPDTIFGIASMTKSFTALAIMQLVEQGKIALNDSPSQYIDFQLELKNAPITIHHMLSHSSGVPSLFGSSLAASQKLGLSKSEIPLNTTEEFLRYLNNAKDEVFDKPGDHFFYNNDMYTILGMIIEKTTKTKFNKYIKEKILIPLEMNSSTARWEEIRNDPNMMMGYLPPVGENPRQAFPVPDVSVDIAGAEAPGSMVSTINDMMKYLAFLMGGDSLKRHHIIQQSSLNKMWTPHIQIPGEDPKPWGDTWYGYGWMIEKDFLTHTLIRHSGDTYIASGHLAFIPGQKLGLIIGSNCSASPEITTIVRGLLALLLGNEFNQAVPEIPIKETLQHLTGRYETYNSVFAMDVYLKNNVLFAKMESFLLPEPLVVPLSPKSIESLEFYIPIAVTNKKTQVQFFINPKSGEISATVNRYWYHKIPSTSK